MSKVIAEISMSLDGCVAGPDPSMEEPLGVGGEQVHEWVVATSSWRDAHGQQGGEATPESDMLAEVNDGIGVTIMGRKMFSGGSGPWEDDTNADGWWGPEPPFRHPVFVLTHHERETTFTFVTDGIESALEQARAAAGDSNIRVAGGAEAIQQYLAAGLVDELLLHTAPVFLGGGRRLFDGAAADLTGKFEGTRIVDSTTGVIHASYKVKDA